MALLGPPCCPASWLASLIKQVEGQPTRGTTPASPVTPLKGSSGKTSSGSGGKKSKSRLILDFWNDSEREKEDEESRKWEEERCRKKSSGGPILSLMEHEEPVSALVSKTTPCEVSQPVGRPSHVVAVMPEFKQDGERTRRSSSGAGISSDDDLLFDKELGLKYKGRKWEYTPPTDVVVVDKDDDEPLPSRKGKTLAKKPKV